MSATVSIFVKGGDSNSPNTIGLIVDVIGFDDVGNAYEIRDVNLDITPDSPPTVIVNVIQNEARQMVINAGGPTVATNDVIVYGGPKI